VNIYQATLAGMRQAARQVDPDYILVDGSPVRDLPAPGRNVIKGDARCASIAAASIIAKVHRDRLMTEYDAQYPGYGFARHKGYGTPQHLEALGRLGPCPIHRRSFAPVANLLAGRPRQPSLPL
jgi:ribonuclease HII